MSIPICPFLMQARASIPRLVVGWEDFRDGEKPASVTDGPLYPNPIEAPGVACIGSRCALWTEETQDAGFSASVIGYGGKPTGRGNCGQAPNREPWPDPAAQEVPRG